jgi:arylsulfatase A-like enzyme
MPEERTRPNIVVFFTDQQRFDTAGVHGNPMDLMPNFDWMARRGTHVSNSFTCQPVCGPARSSLQTGLYATNTGVHCNGRAVKPELNTLAHYFQQAGYDTGYIGKWHLSDAGEVVVPESKRGGYQYWLGANLLEFCSLPYQTVLYDNDDEPVELPGYRVDAIADATIRYLAEHKDSPFFLFTSYLEPHHQNQWDNFPAPDRYAEFYEKNLWIPQDLRTLAGETHKNLAGYYGMVRRLDEALGRVLEALKSLGLAENTIVLFTSDHGCHFKTRNSEYKRSCHESSIRVPTALVGPGFSGGGRLSELISIVDLPPTLLDACGIPVPKKMQGRSILPLVRGERIEWPEEVFVQISEAQVGRAVRTHRWKYSVADPGKDPFVDPGSDTYIEEFLYDLEADPYELTNLIDYDSHREVRKKMRERMIRRMVEAGEKEPSIEEARSGQELRHKPMPDWCRLQRELFPGDVES